MPHPLSKRHQEWTNITQVPRFLQVGFIPLLFSSLWILSTAGWASRYFKGGIRSLFDPCANAMERQPF